MSSSISRRCLTKTFRFLWIASLMLPGCTTPATADSESTVRPSTEQETSRDLAPQPSASAEHVAPRDDESADRDWQPFPKGPTPKSSYRPHGLVLPVKRLDSKHLDLSRVSTPGIYRVSKENPSPIRHASTDIINFEKNDVILAVEGNGSNQLSIKISDVVERKNEVVVDIVQRGPGKGCDVTGDKAPIADAVIVRRTTHPIRVRMRSERLSCETKIKIRR